MTSRNVNISNTLKTDNVDTNTNTHLSIKRNGTEYLKLNTANRVEVSKEFRAVSDTSGNYLRILHSNYLDTLKSDNSSNTMYINYYSRGAIILGSTSGSLPTITVNKFSSNTNNFFEVAGNSVFSGSVSTNMIKSDGNNTRVSTKWNYMLCFTRRCS